MAHSRRRKNNRCQWKIASVKAAIFADVDEIRETLQELLELISEACGVFPENRTPVEWVQFF
jgi:hypothetical protein